MALDSLQRGKIVREVWGLDKQKANKYKVYFDRLETHLMSMPPALQHGYPDTLIMLAKKMMLEVRAACEVYICTTLKISALDEYQIHQYLCLVSDAFFCIDLRSSCWDKSDKLSEFVANHIAVKSSDIAKIRLQKSFNVLNIHEGAGIDVQWTYNINEHLELAGNDDSIKIFVFDTMLQLYEETQVGDIWPLKFITETRNTLSLLLPNEDRKVRKWLAKQHLLDPAVLKCPRLLPTKRYTDHFEYWGSRLIELKEASDNPDPRSFFQLCCNHRKPMQFATFWIASLAFMLSLIACIEGALQVYKAYYPTSA